MSLKLLAVLMIIHLGMALVDLPSLWRDPERGGERWAVISLLSIGLALGALVVFDYMPFSAYRLIESIFKPVGTLLFKLKEG